MLISGARYCKLVCIFWVASTCTEVPSYAFAGKSLKSLAYEEPGDIIRSSDPCLIRLGRFVYNLQNIVVLGKVHIKLRRFRPQEVQYCTFLTHSTGDSDMLEFARSCFCIAKRKMLRRTERTRYSIIEWHRNRSSWEGDLFMWKLGNFAETLCSGGSSCAISQYDFLLHYIKIYLVVTMTST